MLKKEKGLDQHLKIFAEDKQKFLTLWLGSMTFFFSLISQHVTESLRLK